MKTDKSLLFLVFGLTIFGILMVYNASVVEAFNVFKDKYYYLKNQIVWAGVGFILLILAAKIDLKFLKKISGPLFLVNLILLAVVLIPGISTPIKGARRWLNFGFFNLQPSEFIKLTFSFYLASWLNKKRSVLRFLFLIILVGVLVVLEPDFGTLTVIAGTAFCVYFLSGASLKSFFPLAVILPLLGVLIIFISPYRKSRLLTFLDPNRDPLGASYHIRQVLIALGSGGFFGLGLGQSRQKYTFLPEVTTDSIFAVIAEEVGFLGASLVILALLVFVVKGFLISYKNKDNFNRLLGGGITSFLGLQTVLNLSAIVALIPLTGIPLPFISYGGSSLITSLIGAGLLLNISKKEKY